MTDKWRATKNTCKAGSGASLAQKPVCVPFFLPLPQSLPFSWPISSCGCVFGQKEKEERGVIGMLQFIPSPGDGEWSSCRHWLFCMALDAARLRNGVAEISYPKLICIPK